MLYLTTEQVILINEREVGPDAVRDRHLLEAAVERPRQSAFGDDAASEELRVDQDHETHCASVRARITPEDGAPLLAALERSRLNLMSETSAGGSREPPGNPDQADSADKPPRPTNVGAQQAIATAFDAPSALLRVADARARAGHRVCQPVRLMLSSE